MSSWRRSCSPNPRTNRKMLKLFPIPLLVLFIYALLHYIPSGTSYYETDSRMICNDKNCLESETLTHLIMVPGHSVLLNPSNYTLESNWILNEYQRGQLPTLLQHIERAVKLAAKDPASLLIFSGGQSRAQGGPMSEGLSYWLACT
jgi:hypothetical protein